MDLLVRILAAFGPFAAGSKSVQADRLRETLQESLSFHPATAVVCEQMAAVLKYLTARHRPPGFYYAWRLVDAAYLPAGSLFAQVK